MLTVNRIKTISIIITFIMFTTASFSLKADRKQDLEIIIKNSCAVEVISDPNDNCKVKHGQMRGQCGTDKECICMSRNKFVAWTANEDKKFEIKFHDDSPFTRNCKLKSGNNGKIKCKIETRGDFHYDVYVEGCPSKPYDPRIVVE